MSEKRFSLNENYGIHDHDKGIIHDIDTFNGFLEVIFELNNLNNENKELKRQVDELDGYKEEAEYIFKKNKELRKENEQLKKFIVHYERWFRSEGIREIVVGDCKVVLDD